MSAHARITALFLLAGVACAASAATAAPTRASNAGDCFVAGMKAGDADAVAACYAESAVMWFPGGPMAKGRAAIRNGFAGYLTTMTVKDAVLSTIGREEVGKVRVTWGTYAITLVNKATGAELVERGRYTDVQKKIGGRWLYVVDHPSDDPAPPAG